MRGAAPFKNGAEHCEGVKQTSDQQTNGYYDQNDP
jgi:hypothetical protein